MREIKFRAWHKLEKRMIDPVIEIDLTPGEQVIRWYETMNDAMSGCITDEGMANVELMQYTGLKDNNGRGRAMYEGDIYQSEGRLYIIEWSEYSLGWVARSAKSKQVLTGYLQGEVAVYDDYIHLGNIYENPELLGKVE